MLFTPSQTAQLAAASLNPAAIQKLDFMAREVVVNQDRLSGTVDLLSSIADQTIRRYWLGRRRRAGNQFLGRAI
jgi:hypothetical protein